MDESKQWDLFISFTPSDSVWVEGFLFPSLHSANVNFVSEKNLTPGIPFINEYEQYIVNSQRIILVISEAYLANHTNNFIQVLAQTYQLDEETWNVIPLLLDPVKLPLTLRALTPLDMTDPEAQTTAIAHLCAIADKKPPGPLPKPACPYPGMVPFSREYSRYFCGREMELDRLVAKLRHNRNLFLVGQSACGKTSLIIAGLLPYLDEKQPDQWRILMFHPASDPLTTLTGQLRDVFGDEDEVPGDHAVWIETIARRLPDSQRLLIIIDQFEQLWTQASANAQQEVFALLKKLREVERCVVLVILRLDFFGNLIQSPLKPIPDHQLLDISSLENMALEEAIVKPASKRDVSVEKQLIVRLCADAAHEPGVMPLLQETMQILWQKMQDRQLRMESYQSMGRDGRSGLAVALADKADGALNELTLPQREIAVRIFLRLVQFGEGREHTRRQQLVAALQSANDDTQFFDEALEVLEANRLLTFSYTPLKRMAVADVAMEPKQQKSSVNQDIVKQRTANLSHESLITSWQTFQSWIKEYENAERTRRRLEDRAQAWSDDARHGDLLDNIALSDAETWLDSHEAKIVGYSTALKNFITESRKHLRPSMNLLGMVTLGMMAVAAISLLGVMLLFFQVSRLDETLRLVLWIVLLILGLSGLALFISILRNDRYWLARLSKKVVDHRYLPMTANLLAVSVLLASGATASEIFERENGCTQRSFVRTQPVGIALIGEGVSQAELDVFKGFLQQIGSQDDAIGVWLIDSDQANRCWRFFDYQVTLKQVMIDGQSMYYANVSGLRTYIQAGSTKMRFKRHECGLFNVIAYEVGNRLHLSSVTIDETERPGAPDCRAYLWYQEGADLFRQRKLAAAEDVVQDLLKEYENFAEAHALLGRVYYENNKPALAIDELLKAIDYSSANAASFWEDLAVAYYRNFEYPQAEQANFLALTLNPESVGTRLRLSTLYREWGRIDDARIWLDLAEDMLEKTSMSATNRSFYRHTLYKNRGILAFQRQAWKQAIEFLDLADQESTDFYREEIMFYRAWAYEHLDKSRGCQEWRRYMLIDDNKLFRQQERRTIAGTHIITLSCP